MASHGRSTIQARWIVLVAASALLVSSTTLAPAPVQVAINYKTKQCATYWGGDEYVQLDLPPGWIAYDYQFSNDGDYQFVETRAGTCKLYTNATVDPAESCCSQLGYHYIHDSNNLYNSIGVYGLRFKKIALNDKTRQCGIFWAGDENTSYDLPRGWTAYNYQLSDTETFVETPAGMCTLSEPWTLNLQSCCSRLGYSYVPNNVGVEVKIMPHDQTVMLYNIVSSLIVVIIVAIAIWLAILVKKEITASKK